MLLQTVDVLMVLSTVFVAFAIIVLWRSAKIVPQGQVFVVERWGRFQRILEPGVNIVFPFWERIAYKHSVKEQAMDVPEQVCVTKDNVQVGVDGVIFFQILDPRRASYGIEDYVYAISQLAQTTLRSEIGRIELDKLFEERGMINTAVVAEIDKASASWGVKALRYEIMKINPPREVLSAMENQMKAEREKRALILESEGHRDAQINRAEGDKQKLIKESEARKEQQINEAHGRAEAILAISQATAEGVERVAQALSMDNGVEALQMRLAEQYIEQFGKLSEKSNSLIVPANVADISSMVAVAMKVKESISSSSGGQNSFAPIDVVPLSANQSLSRPNSEVELSQEQEEHPVTTIELK